MAEDKINTNEELSPEKLTEFLSQKKLIEIINSYNEACIEAEKKVDFNIFRMLSDYYYRENFHGDILEVYLNPEGHHGEGDKFLKLFLNNILGEEKSLPYSRNSKLFREYHINGNRRIDFVIINENEDHCIIIENKLYDAVDMDNQLPAYVDAMQEKYGKDSVDAVIYLPLSSDKVPDKRTWKKDIEPILEIVSAERLIKDWLDPSIGECEIVDNKVILRHYKELLESLKPEFIKYKSYMELYEYIMCEDNLKKVLTLQEMLNNIGEPLNMQLQLKLKEKGINSTSMPNVKAGFVIRVHKNIDIYVYCGQENLDYAMRIVNRNNNDPIYIKWLSKEIQDELNNRIKDYGYGLYIHYCLVEVEKLIKIICDIVEAANEKTNIKRDN